MPQRITDLLEPPARRGTRIDTLLAPEEPEPVASPVPAAPALTPAPPSRGQRIDQLVTPPAPAAAPRTEAPEPKTPLQATGEAADAAAKGIIYTVSTLPQTVGSLVKQFGENLESSSSFWDQVGAVGPMGFLRQALTPPGMPDFKQLREMTAQAFEKSEADERVAGAGQSLIDHNKAFITAHPEAFQTADGKLNSFMFNLGSGVTTLAAAMGLTAMTRNPSAAALAFGVYQDGQLYQEAREAGELPTAASVEATAGGAIESALEYIGLERFFKAYGGPLKTHLVRAATEMTQEWSQQVGENAVAANWRQYPSFWNLFDNAGQAAMIGGLLGVPASALLSAGQKAGFVKELQDIGVPKEEAKSLVNMVITRQTEEFAKQATTVLAEETGQAPGAVQEAPVPGDTAAKPLPLPGEAADFTLDFTPNPRLTEAEKIEETAAYEWLAEAPAQRVDDYLTRFPKTVNPDNAKEMLPGYSGLNANALHEVSSTYAKLVYDKLLRTEQGQGNNTVLVTGGGSGAGKTNVIRDSIPTAEYPIILDTNLSGVKSAITKIDQAKKAGFAVDIVYVHRDPITSFTQGVVPRAVSKNRVVGIADHVNRHLESPSTLLRLAAHYQGDPAVTFQVLNNNFGKGQAKEGSLDLLRQGGYTQSELEGALNEALTELERTGEVPTAYAARLRGRLEPPSAARRPGERAGDPAGSARTSDAGGAGSAPAPPPVPPVVTPTTPDPAPEHRGLTPTATLLKARLTKLGTDLKHVEALMGQIEGQRAQLAQRGIGHRGVDARLLLLSKRFTYLDSSIAELLTSAPEDIRAQLLAEPGTLELNELLKAEDRAARVAKHQTIIEQRIVQAQHKAELIEAFRTRQETLEQRRQRLTDYIKATLPLASRGKFLTMVRMAPTEQSLIKSIMRISAEADTVQRKQLLSELKASVKDALEAPSIAVEYRARIQQLVNQFELTAHRPETVAELEATREYVMDRVVAEGENADLPLQVLARLDILARTPIARVPARQIASVLEQVQLLARLGKTKLDARQNLYQAEKDVLLRQLIAGSKPLELRALHQTKPGETLTSQQILENVFWRHLNAAQQADATLSPMNVVFDLLDGLKGYHGANSRVFKQRVDASFGRFLNYKDALLTPIFQLNSQLGMTPQNYERIGVHAYRMQPGGLRYLQNLGLTEAEINAIKLTPAEQQLYDAMRTTIERPFPQVQQLTRDLYNRDVQKVLNYFPVQTDWDKMSVQEIVDLTENPEFRRLQKNVEQGFTMQRKGGKQKVKLNALDIFQKHMTDVAYFLSLGRDIKLLSEVAQHPDYQAAAGEFGQHLVRRWLDILARMGGVDGDKRIAALDALRRNFGAAQLGFKLSSILIQPTALFDGAAQIGGGYVFQGFNRVLTDQNWRAFLRTVPELRARGADDPAFLELADNPTLARLQAAGYGPLQQADLLTASAVFAGAYQRALDARGVPLDLTTPHQEALQEATTMLQRTQSSAYFKDTPLALSGVGLTGNKSVNKMLLQFRSFMLTRWAQVRHDAWRAGFQQGDFKTGAHIMAWLTAATFAEAGIRAVSSKAVQMAVLAALAGKIPWEDIDKKLDEEFEDLPADILYEIIGTVPFLDTFIARTYYKGQAIPAIAFIDALRQGVNKLTTAKTAPQRMVGAIRFMEGVAQAYGLPGASQAATIAQGLTKPIKAARKTARRAP